MLIWITWLGWYRANYSFPSEFCIILLRGKSVHKMTPRNRALCFCPWGWFSFCFVRIGWYLLNSSHSPRGKRWQINMSPCAFSASGRHVTLGTLVVRWQPPFSSRKVWLESSYAIYLLLTLLSGDHFFTGWQWASSFPSLCFRVHVCKRKGGVDSLSLILPTTAALW